MYFSFIVFNYLSVECAQPTLYLKDIHPIDSLSDPFHLICSHDQLHTDTTVPKPTKATFKLHSGF